jgi:hypothetical protein
LRALTIEPRERLTVSITEAVRGYFFGRPGWWEVVQAIGIFKSATEIL